MTGKHLTDGDIPEIVEAVVSALDKREADKKKIEDAVIAAAFEAERQARIAAVAARLEVEREAEKRKMEDCKHDKKHTHDFLDGIQRLTRCIDCCKVWKEQQPAPCPKTKKCDHYREGLYGGSEIHEIRRGVVRCSRCLEQWGKSDI